jgi:hypothetical protein
MLFKCLLLIIKIIHNCKSVVKFRTIFKLKRKKKGDISLFVENTVDFFVKNIGEPSKTKLYLLVINPKYNKGL